jgi:hypothetical protein
MVNSPHHDIEHLYHTLFKALLIRFRLPLGEVQAVGCRRKDYYDEKLIERSMKEHSLTSYEWKTIRYDIGPLSFHDANIMRCIAHNEAVIIINKYPYQW